MMGMFYLVMEFLDGSAPERRDHAKGPLRGLHGALTITWQLVSSVGARLMSSMWCIATSSPTTFIC